MKTLFASALAFLVAAVASCTAPGETSGENIIEGRNATFSEAFASGDGTAVASMYADAAVVMPDGANPVQGREAIAQFWQGFIDSGAARIELTTDETISAGSTSISERGRFRILDAAGAPIGEGKYVVVGRSRMASGCCGGISGTRMLHRGRIEASLRSATSVSSVTVAPFVSAVLPCASMRRALT